MNYEDAGEQLYIKKTDIEFSIGLVKQGNEFVPMQSSALLEAMKIAIEVLAKQTPKAPIETQELTDIEWLCPVCMSTVGDCVEVDNYCRQCGQKILF